MTTKETGGRYPLKHSREYAIHTPHERRRMQEQQEREEALGFPYADYEAAGWRCIGKGVLFIIAIVVFTVWAKP